MSNNLLTLMDNFFDDFRPLSNPALSRSLTYSPALNVKEYKDKYEISLSAAGIDPAKIKVELADRNLNISYDSEDKKEEKDEGLLIREEYRHFSFTRSITLPKNVDAESIVAESKNGILKIKVKKLPEAQSKTVNVKIK